jgi:hypothetical protein
MLGTFKASRLAGSNRRFGQVQAITATSRNCRIRFNDATCSACRKLPPTMAASMTVIDWND